MAKVNVGLAIKQELMSEPLKPRQKDWAPRSHNQKCSQFSKEYILIGQTQKVSILDSGRLKK